MMLEVWFFSANNFVCMVLLRDLEATAILELYEKIGI